MYIQSANTGEGENLRRYTNQGTGLREKPLWAPDGLDVDLRTVVTDKTFV